MNQLRWSCRHLHICDMIKGNKLDVTNIDFELQAKKEVTNSCLILFLNFKKLHTPLQVDV